MKLKSFFGVFILLLSMTSCIDIFDDITLHNDGTGTFKYHVNLSGSKVKINSILALDSIDGKKVPSIPEIKTEIARIKNILETKEGISNVSIESNFENFIFDIKCDFDQISSLEKAIKTIVQSENLVKNLENLNEDWFTWSEDKFIRNNPEFQFKKSFTPNEIELLSQGKYRSITRFDRTIDSFENSNSKVNPTKVAIAVSTSIYSLIQNSNLLENTIYLSPLK